MERFFPKEKIVLTGNPVRQGLVDSRISKAEASEKFGLDKNLKTVLIIGGSLGARTLNESVLGHLDEIRNSDVQFIWQTGKYYSDEIKKRMSEVKPLDNLRVMDFISDMDYAYAVADLVVSRAGAGSISELCVLNKPAILIPSPNVAEDHQTKNAMALANKSAAIFLKDADAPEKLVEMAINTVNDSDMLRTLAENAGKMAFRNSADVIADEVCKLAEEYKNSNK